MANTVLTKSGIGEERGLARIAQRMAAWTEKWFPDAYIFALAGVIIIALAALAIGASPQSIADSFGNGFWDLTAFTLQMAMVVLTGYVVATSPPVAQADQPAGPDSRHRPHRRELRGADVDVGVLPQLGPQPDLRRPPGPGHRPPQGPDRGLPRARRRSLHGPRRRLGARPVLLRGAAAGHRGLAAAGPAEDHRHPGLRHHHLHLAVAAHPGHPDGAHHGDRALLGARRAAPSAPRRISTSTSTTNPANRSRAPARANGSNTA